MSRFGNARWKRLAVWSGAALAWGSTITAAILEPARVAHTTPSPQVDIATEQAPLPTQPASGLLVIRYQPDEAVEVPSAAAPPSPVRGQAQPAPQPISSGS
jgi:hypothetical protein